MNTGNSTISVWWSLPIPSLYGLTGEAVSEYPVLFTATHSARPPLSRAIELATHHAGTHAMARISLPYYVFCL